MRRCNQVFAGMAILALIAPALRADVMDDDLAAARNLLEDGKQEEAAAKFDALRKNVLEAVANNPQDAHALYIFGSVCMYGGDDDSAAKAIDRAIALEPANGAYQTAKGTLLWFQEKTQEAMPFFQKGAELSPKSADAWRGLGSAQLELKDFAGALASFQKAVDLAPKNPRPLGLMGQALTAAGKNEEAMKAYQKAVEIDPKYVMAWSNIGQMEQAAGHMAEAFAAYQKVLAETPADWRTLARVVQVSEALHQVKDRDLAREKLFALYKAKKIDEEMYCREQTVFEKKPVIVFEYFELTGKEAVRYAFVVLGTDGKPERRISLGTDDATNVMARAAGEIKGDERMFHLEMDAPGGAHGSLGMFKQEPTYEETRAMVMDYLGGKLKVGASGTMPAAK